MASEEATSTPAGDGRLRRNYRWAVLVAAILIAASALTVSQVTIDGSDDISVTIVPKEIPNVPAGRSQNLSALVAKDGALISDEVDIEWSIEPDTLGSLVNETEPETVFEAGETAASGVVRLDVSHGGNAYSAEAPLTVGPPVLESVSISPSAKTLLVDEECMFNASVRNSVGYVAEEAVVEWIVIGAEAGEFFINNTSGLSVIFSASKPANVTLTAEATLGDGQETGSAIVTVSPLPSLRTIDYRFYDMFAYPINEWVVFRDAGCSWPGNPTTEYTDEYPYLHKPTVPPLSERIWSFMRLNVTGFGVTELNMNENPVFLPYLSGEDGERGGNAVVDMNMHYMTEAEQHAFLPGAMTLPGPTYVRCDWSVTFDRQAAKAVLGLTDGEFEDFENWWAANDALVENAWEEWLRYEGNDRYPIFNAYYYNGYYLDGVIVRMDANRVDDEHLMMYVETGSWGMEFLMARWMNAAWAPVEWLMEDMNLHAVISTEEAEISLDAAVEFSLFASDPGTEGIPSWIWQPKMLDHIESTPQYPESTFDPYADFEFYFTGSGSQLWYGEMIPYDYTPAAWNLSAGETLTIEWPGDEQLFLLHDAEGTGEGTFENTTDLYSHMTVEYPAPSPSDSPDQISIDYDQHRIRFEGPLDMWTWSREQSNHEFLADGWDQIGRLPFGVPYIEFSAVGVLDASVECECESGQEDRIDGSSNPIHTDGATMPYLSEADELSERSVESRSAPRCSGRIIRGT